MPLFYAKSTLPSMALGACLLAVCASCAGEGVSGAADGGVSLLDPAAVPDAEMGEGECSDADSDDGPAEAGSLSGDGQPVQGRVCGGDEDWFIVELAVGASLEASLTFSHGEGDLDITLFDPDLEQVRSSASSDDDERLEYVSSSAGAHYLQVFGFESAAASYQLSALVSGQPAGCADDAQEENDAPISAVQLHPPERLDGVLCSADDDFFLVELEAGQTLQVRTSFSHAEGDLDLRLTDPEGVLVAESASSDDDEFVSYEAVASGPHYLEVSSFGSAEARYVLTSNVVGFDGAPHEVSGRVLFDDPFLSRGQLRVTLRPLVGAVVEVVDEASAQILGLGHTDGLGRYRVRFDGGESEEVYTRVLARSLSSDIRFDVVTGQGSVYGVRSPEPYAPAIDRVEDFELRSDQGVNDPLNIVDAIGRATQWWRHRFGIDEPMELRLVWEEGEILSCGTCYRHSEAPPTIYLYGVENDNDALDDPVILHEFGHYVMNRFSTDSSPGGDHDGTPVDPRLAYAEGWATAFSGMVRDNPRYYDTRGDALVLHDLESPDEDFSVYTGEGLTGAISEYLVSSIIWDFYDDAADAGDTVAAGVAAVLPVVEYLADGAHSSRGVSGLDFVDYLDGAFCLDIAADAAMGLRLSAAEFPYLPPEGCKASAPVTVEAAPGGQLLVAPTRPLDAMVVLRCVKRGCVEVVAFNSGDPVLVPAVTQGRLEVRMSRGDSIWAEVWTPSGRGGAAVDRAPWLPATAARDGAAVVERRASP